VELRSCRYVNVKPGRVGGFTAAVAIHDICRGAGIPCWVGGMLESAVGTRTCIALAMLDNFTYPADIFPSRRFYAQDLSQPEVELAHDERGVPCVIAPQVPGTGAEPHAELLPQCTRQFASIRPTQSGDQRV